MLLHEPLLVLLLGFRLWRHGLLLLRDLVSLVVVPVALLFGRRLRGAEVVGWPLGSRRHRLSLLGLFRPGLALWAVLRLLFEVLPVVSEARMAAWVGCNLGQVVRSILHLEAVLHHEID